MDIPDSSGVTGGEMTDAEAFVAEYYWLRSFGMTDAAIARTLRVTEDQLVKRLQRAKVRREALSPDPDIDGRLRALIATGEPFDSWDFPLALEPYQVAAAISVAVRRGVVVRVGERRAGAGRGGLFQEAEAATQVDAASVEYARSVVALARAVGVVA